MTGTVPCEDDAFRCYGDYSKADDMSRLNNVKEYLEKAVQLVSEIEDTVAEFNGTVDDDYDALFDAEISAGCLFNGLEKAKREIDFVYESLYSARRGYEFNKYFKILNKKENDNYGNE